MSFPLPPYAQLQNFLAQEELEGLLRWVLENEQSFAPAMIRSGNDAVLNEAKRVALTSANLGPLKPLLKEKLRDALPSLMAKVGATGPEPGKLEIELAAHGDGAHYMPHTDLPIGATRAHRDITDDRVLSAVLYFHAEPKAFSGGALRLFRIGVDPNACGADDFLDIEPLQNSLAVFHSWVSHEVRPVKVPTGRFHDYRFAVNIWFRRKLGTG